MTGFYIPDYGNVPKIELEEIAEPEFERYRESHHPQLDPSLSRVQHTRTFQSANRSVEGLVWINDHAFAVKFKIGKSDNDVKYFKTKDLRDLGK